MPNAPVSLVVFSDFQCSFCKEEAKLLRQNVATGTPTPYALRSRIFRWSRFTRGPSGGHRRTLRVPSEAPLFWDYHDWIFENQGEITGENLKDKFTEWAKTKPLEPIQLAACIDNKTTEPEVARNQTEGKALAINSTPTLFINGRRLVGGVPWQQMKPILDHEMEYAKSTHAQKNAVK